MRAIFAIAITAFLASCKQDTGALDQRADYWRRSLTTELPVGSSTKQVQDWAKLHNVEFMFLPEQHQFYANVEQVPVKGFQFPCGAWNIILQVTVDATGHSTKNEVKQVGTCV